MEVTDFVQRIASRTGHESQPRGDDNYDLCCPCHDDQQASLSVSKVSGKILVCCHAGCETEDIVGTLGLTMSDLFLDNGSTQRPHISETYDYRDEDGKVLYQVVRYIPKDFRQRRPDLNKPGQWIWNLKGVRQVLYRLPELIKVDAATPVFIVEGEKDVDRCRSVGLVSTCNSGGAKKWKAEYNTFFKGRHVVIIPDNEKAGHDHAQKVAASLNGTAASVKVVKLPGVTDKGFDVSDWLGAGHAIDELTSLVEEQLEWTDSQPDHNVKSLEGHKELPRIYASIDEKKVIDEAIDALATAGGIYQRAGTLVHVVENGKCPRGIARDTDSPRIVPVTLPRLREMMSTAANWFKLGKNGFEPGHPPLWAVKGVDARGEWPPIPRIEAVTESVTLRANGSILEKPGYDADTGLFYAPRETCTSVKSTPTRDDAVRAKDMLLDVWRDFPLATQEHCAACLAACLTPFARYAYNGPTPLFLVDANVRGAGKGLLVDSWSTIFNSRRMARMTIPKNDDECRKRITAIAMANESLVLLDNVTGSLNLPSLDAALTATSWNDRVLGKSELTGEIPLYTIWYLTANNVLIDADTARRTVHIRLESPEERPEERSDFHHLDLLA